MWVDDDRGGAAVAWAKWRGEDGVSGQTRRWRGWPTSNEIIFAHVLSTRRLESSRAASLAELRVVSKQSAYLAALIGTEYAGPEELRPHLCSSPPHDPLPCNLIQASRISAFTPLFVTVFFCSSLPRAVHNALIAQEQLLRRRLCTRAPSAELSVPRMRSTLLRRQPPAHVSERGPISTRSFYHQPI